MFDFADYPDADQKVYRYAYPILLASETMASCNGGEIPKEKLEEQHWWRILDTTRIILAHMTMVDDKSELLKTAARNTRNLYRLFGIDLKVKKAWNDVDGDDLYFKEVEGKKRWISLRDTSKTIATLTQIGFNEVERQWNEVNDPDVARMKSVFGHCVYKEIATRLDSWKSAASEFSTIQL